MKLTKNYLFLIGFFCIAGFSYFYFSLKQENYKEITSFEACTRAGFTITSTYPEQCVMPGKSFTNPNQKGKVLGVAVTGSLPETQETYKNLTYFFEGQAVIFKDGMGLIELGTPLKKARTTLSFTDIASTADINNDSNPDTTFLVKTTEENQNKSKYYLTAAVSLNNGYSGLNALYIGTNITPLQLFYEQSEIVFIYKDEFSVDKKKYFKLVHTILEEVNR